MVHGVAANRRRRRSVMLAVVGLLVVGPDRVIAEAASPTPSFSTDPALEPVFAFAKHDYAILCTTLPVTVDVRVPGRWQGQVGGTSFRPESFSVRRALSPGKAVTVTFRKRGRRVRSRYHVRCLPSDFPAYDFHRIAPGGPKLFSIHQTGGRYAAIHNGDGVPVWWLDVGSPAFVAEILADGTFASGPAVPDINVQEGSFSIYSLTGELLRVVRAANGLAADLHELRLLPNGNYVLAADLPQEHVDTTAYGGSSTDDTVVGAEIQELTPQGELVWAWDSHDHIGTDETTAQWWPQVYGSETPTSRLLHNDIVHPNAVAVTRGSYLVSFRHLDAVYKISRRTGNIVWKLGGTTTPRSLEVRGDPYPYPLGGQHDVRLQPDGTITIYDNRTLLDAPPRAVRYRINEHARTARLVEAVSDPEISSSPFMGSARRLSSGAWLVGWGGTRDVAGYDSTGQRGFTLRLETPVGSYRATPVPPGAVTIRALRRAMNRMSR